MRTRALAGLLGLLVLASCGGGDSAAASLRTGTLTVHTAGDAVRLRVEVADTEATRARGLMGRTSLAPDAGMAFLFDEPTRASFWMKDTRIPLSIAFWNASDRIVEILDMEPCTHDPCPVYTPGSGYVGAVEANVGFFRDHGIGIGDAIQLDA